MQGNLTIMKVTYELKAKDENGIKRLVLNL